MASRLGDSILIWSSKLVGRIVRRNFRISGHHKWMLAQKVGGAIGPV